MEIYWDILVIIKKRSLGKLGSRSQLCKWLKQVETSWNHPQRIHRMLLVCISMLSLCPWPGIEQQHACNDDQCGSNPSHRHKTFRKGFIWDARHGETSDEQTNCLCACVRKKSIRSQSEHEVKIQLQLSSHTMPSFPLIIVHAVSLPIIRLVSGHPNRPWRRSSERAWRLRKTHRSVLSPDPIPEKSGIARWHMRDGGTAWLSGVFNLGRSVGWTAIQCYIINAIWQCVKTLYPCSSHQNSW